MKITYKEKPLAAQLEDAVRMAEEDGLQINEILLTPEELKKFLSENGLQLIFSNDKRSLNETCRVGSTGVISGYSSSQSYMGIRYRIVESHNPIDNGCNKN